MFVYVLQVVTTRGDAPVVAVSHSLESAQFEAGGRTGEWEEHLNNYSSSPMRCWKARPPGLGSMAYLKISEFQLG